MVNFTIKSSSICIYPEDVRNHCDEIANESVIFVNSKILTTSLQRHFDIYYSLTGSCFFQLYLVPCATLALKEFQEVLERVTNYIKNASKEVEYKKTLVIGLRNAIEIEHECCNQRRSQLQQIIGEKTDILKRLELEYNALEEVIISQDMEKRSIS